MSSILIGHRGEPDNWPENSLAGFEAVLAAGAHYIETDVQLTADGIPVLSHDPSLLRVTGRDVMVTASSYEEIKNIPAGYEDRFGKKFHGYRIAPLEKFAELLQQWPAARAFIELKDASLVAHGYPRVIDTVMDIIRPVAGQCIMISFDYEALMYLRAHYQTAVGWVLPEWSNSNRLRAVTLEPEYLFCNRKRLPPDSEPLWPGPWQWAVYTVNNPDEAQALLQRGIQLVETNAIRQMMTEPRLGAGSHGD
jgi:glycerophosphoryl diester phosphodiesterase